ncbi:GAF domain-containing sensor histidine kinase [Polaribacter vadi]|uniref:GAF domain-containing sensor histidine kinase n=1 Tax=Polaribacter TaxID=52959 RepID=UPI001C089D5F|nr:MULTISPECIES: GAF domain-containing sensor histidine kinase [Polaribacter]MBU3012558.1 GAF domain-containing sensor histidine kinase [Polaribacter vadi]MDO6742375.1 GAF domain-containing sensor histidine kinase [Polaribacter sp. 1_MG-2023]
MESAEIPKNEVDRLQALEDYKIIDTLPEDDYDALSKIASSICNTPIALISLIDEKRQWFKSHHGVDATETPRELAFCAHSILNPDELFIVNDATKDERFYDNPLTTKDPNVIFYAGAPLKSPEGYPLGTLCVIDNKPNNLNDSQKEALQLLAKQVISLLELRKKNNELKKASNKTEKLNERLNDFAYRLTHDLKSPINGVNFLLDVLNEDHGNLFKNTEAESHISLISNRMVYMGTLIDDILEYTKVNTENIVYEDINIKMYLDSIIKNIDFENKIYLNSNALDTSIKSSKIGFVQVFQNLISNSRKYSDEEKVELEIDFKETAEHYHFIYRDNGPGIAQKYWSKVFEMFETLNNTNSQNTGIGLATVKSIIKRLGGEIFLQNREDGKKGVCFFFHFSKKEVIEQ